MKKTIYIARAERHDSFDLGVTYDLAEAKKIAEDRMDHLTAKEKEITLTHIDGYTVEVLDGESAGAAYHRLLIDDELPCDPDYYEELNEEHTMTNTYYFINDGVNPDTIYGNGDPVCIDLDEVKRLSAEWGVDLMEQMHEASEDEIAEYGIEEEN